jgi:hypothetical protein
MTASSSNLLAEAKKLSATDRLELIGELWDTLEDSDLPVTTEERTLMGPAWQTWRRTPRHRTRGWKLSPGLIRAVIELPGLDPFSARHDIADAEDWYDEREPGARCSIPKWCLAF